jgi:hypothetical protein
VSALVAALKEDGRRLWQRLEPAGRKAWPAVRKAGPSLLWFACGALAAAVWLKRTRPVERIVTLVPGVSEVAPREAVATVALSGESGAAEAALVGALEIIHFEDRLEALRELARLLATTDLAQALALGQRIPNFRDRVEYYRVLMRKRSGCPRASCGRRVWRRRVPAGWRMMPRAQRSGPSLIWKA